MLREVLIGGENRHFQIENAGHSISRNDPCSCGSNRKFKKCCKPVIEEKERREAKLRQEMILIRATLSKYTRWVLRSTLTGELIVDGEGLILGWPYRETALAYAKHVVPADDLWIPEHRPG